MSRVTLVLLIISFIGCFYAVIAGYENCAGNWVSNNNYYYRGNKKIN